MEKNTSNKRGKIIQAAIDLIAENGLHGCPTSLIAQKAGVGMGTIYRYFKNKDSLIDEAHDEIKYHIEETIFTANNQKTPARERFLQIFSDLLKYFITHPSIFRFMEQYYNSPYGVDKKRQPEACGKQPLHRFLDHAKEQQIIRDLDNKILFAFAMGPISFMVKDHLAGFVHLDDALIREVIKTSWDAVKR